jgi:hypothetical protein
MKRVQLLVGAAIVALLVPALALAAPASPAVSAKVSVTLTDTKLRVSPSGLQAGSTTFTVVNTGKRLHAFQISGPGLKTGLATSKLAPGKRATMTVNLKSGAYMLTLSDPVGLGMSATHWLQVIPRTVVHASGGGIVQTPPDSETGVCGGVMP